MDGERSSHIEPVTIDDVRRMVIGSESRDWVRIDCSSGEGPSFLNGAVEDGESSAHAMRAALRSDVRIGLAWGLGFAEQTREDWTKKLPDPMYRRQTADIIFAGMLIDRYQIASVDGGRAYLPFPYLETVEIEGAESRKVYHVTPREAAVARLVDSLSGRSRMFEHYMTETGIEIREATPDADWGD